VKLKKKGNDKEEEGNVKLNNEQEEGSKKKIKSDKKRNSDKKLKKKEMTEEQKENEKEGKKNVKLKKKGNDEENNEEKKEIEMVTTDEDEINEIIMEEKGEEDKSSSFSFEEDSSLTESISSQTSTDLSSTVDEFATQAPEIKISDDAKDKMKKKIKNLKKKEKDFKLSDPRGVIYLGHLPYGFFENQLKGFFSQFGVITRLRVSRNKKTGNSKHYCFIEFLDPMIATIVADTMDGYILFGRSLKCKVIPPEKVHSKIFAGSNKKFYPKRTILKHRTLHNAPKSQKSIQNNTKKLIRKEEKKREKLKQLGISYDFPGYKSENVQV